MGAMGARFWGGGGESHALAHESIVLFALLCPCFRRQSFLLTNAPEVVLPRFLFGTTAFFFLWALFLYTRTGAILAFVTVALFARYHNQMINGQFSGPPALRPY